MTISNTDALVRVIEHREIFHDEMLTLMRRIMGGEMSPVMIAAAIITGDISPPMMRRMSVSISSWKISRCSMTRTRASVLLMVMGPSGSAVHFR